MQHMLPMPFISRVRRPFGTGNSGLSTSAGKLCRLRPLSRSFPCSISSRLATLANTFGCHRRSLGSGLPTNTNLFLGDEAFPYARFFFENLVLCSLCCGLCALAAPLRTRWSTGNSSSHLRRPNDGHTLLEAVIVEFHRCAV